jgi:hypothetical protein
MPHVWWHTSRGDGSSRTHFNRGVGRRGQLCDTRGDQRPWSEKWQRILRGRDAISEAYAAEGRALGNLEVEGRVTSFFSDCYHLRDWLIGDRGSMPGVTPAGLDEYIRNSYPLSLSQAICNTDKHHSRSRGVTARIRKTVVSPRGARVTLEIDWATPQAAEIDALDLANDLCTSVARVL